jgi:CDP-4-dehydro-6-deoxyglucose reductase, E1
MPDIITWPLMKNNISREDLDRVIDLLSKDDPKLTHGPHVKEFEDEWSKWLGVSGSVMVNSGASANDLTMMAIKELFGPGEVIVPALTWVSDIASVLNTGMTPVFVDIDPQSLGMSLNSIQRSISPKTRAVFLTHVLGFNAISNELLKLLKDSNIPLIEDVCESHGATHNGKKVGSFGLASNFSFYYAHHMTTIEGGIISSDDQDFLEIVRMMRSHGMVREARSAETRMQFKSDYPDLNPDFIFAYSAHNMRPTEIQGILGKSQLPRLDSVVQKRAENFNLFLECLDGTEFHTDFKTLGNSNYAFTLIMKEQNFQKRDSIEIALRQAGIEFRRGLAGGGNQLRQPYLRKLSDFPKPETFPNTDHVHHFAWYLGNYPDLNLDFFKTLKFALSNF